MTPVERTQVASHIAAGILCLVLAACGFALTQTIDRTMDGMNQALATINDGCHDNGHQVVCGTLAQVGQTTKNVGLMAAQGAEQVKQSGALITATTKNLDAVGASVTGTMGHLSTTADAGTTLLGTANTKLGPLMDTTTSTIGTLNAAIALHSQQLAISEADFNKILAGLPPIEDNVQQVTKGFITTIGTTNHMLETGDQVETKITECTLHPHFACYAKSGTLFGAQVLGYVLH